MSTSTRKSVEEAILDSLRRFGNEINRIEPAQDLQNDLGIDSVELVELVASISKHFGLASRGIDVDDIVTVRDLAEQVEKNLSTAMEG